MKEPTRFTWDDVRQIADEIEVKAHLASMDVRDRWEKLRPRFAELKQTIEREGAQAGKTVGEQMTTIGKGLRKLLDQIKDEVAARRPS